MERPKTELEEIGERCIQVVRQWGETTEEGLRKKGLTLIAEFAWALGANVSVALVPFAGAAEPPDPSPPSKTA
jgi:hypothetical protein